MATELPIFVDTPEGETPEPGTPDVDAAYLNAMNLAVNNVENALPTKADVADLATVATSGAYTDLLGTPFIPNSPDDIGAQPTGSYATSSDLTTGLAGKANTSHTQAISTITNLQTTLDGKTAPAGASDFPSPVGTANTVGTAVVAARADHVHRLSTGDRALLDGAQPGDADLTAIAALSPANDSVLQRKAGAWTSRTIVQLRADLHPSRTVTYAATITLDPTVAGDRIGITATSDITSLGASPTGAADWQVLQVAVLASSGTRAVTLASAIRTTTGVTRGPHSIPSGEVLRLALEYSALTSAWSVVAAVVTAA